MTADVLKQGGLLSVEKFRRGCGEVGDVLCRKLLKINIIYSALKY